jgi:hypothetical protein
VRYANAPDACDVEGVVACFEPDGRSKRLFVEATRPVDEPFEASIGKALPDLAVRELN